ncbi:branched-chain amino acid ABC transporter permease [Peterkaempfera bronchialis]|uniref:branched-chain amino acid ABC transporter permease n=1 Tax=Peterkaempfera bronchialis TaxID=2126346 RepID=UPI003C2D5E80
MNAILGRPRLRPALITALALIALMTPWVIKSSYLLGVLILGLIWLTLNQSWNLVLGVSGVWNFGHLALYAVGGYAGGLFSLHTGLSSWIGLLVGGLAAGAGGVLLAIPSLRLRGIYAALLTFSFAYVIQLVITSDRSGLTGGSFGLTGYHGLAFGTTDATAVAHGYYWTALAVTLVTAAAMLLVTRSPMGLAFVALRENAPLAAARGISPITYQVLSFGISGFFAGLAGALYAYYFGVITPTVMGLGPMTIFVTMMVVGGLGTLSGPFVGTALILAVQTALEDYPQARLIVLGAVLVAMVVIMPRGIVDAVGAINRRIERWVAEGEEAEDEADDRADEPVQTMAGRA